MSSVAPPTSNVSRGMPATATSARVYGTFSRGDANTTSMPSLLIADMARCLHVRPARFSTSARPACLEFRHDMHSPTNVCKPRATPALNKSILILWEPLQSSPLKIKGAHTNWSSKGYQVGAKGSLCGAGEHVGFPGPCRGPVPDPGQTQLLVNLGLLSQDEHLHRIMAAAEPPAHLLAAVCSPVLVQAYLHAHAQAPTRAPLQAQAQEGASCIAPRLPPCSCQLQTFPFKFKNRAPRSRDGPARCAAAARQHRRRS